MGATTMSEWTDRMAAEHEAAVELEKHDEQCEVDVRGFFLCHCSKRRREARGLTEPPTDDLYFPPPRCTKCDERLYHDGDGWACEDCSLSWDSSGAGRSARFTDVYGDDLVADAERWRSKQKEVSC